MQPSAAKQLHEKVEAAFGELDVVVGWGNGFDPLHMTPIFISGPDEISRLTWSPLCVQNLTGYLAKGPGVQPEGGGKKIGICVKGCDSRSLVALIQEKLISRDKLYIIGFPCWGAVDWRRVMRELELSEIQSVNLEERELVIEDSRGVHRLSREKVLARKCLRCRYPNPILYDVLIGEPVAPETSSEDGYRDVEAIERLSLEERLGFWQKELDRCMRCYACRNACPLCVCQDRCIAETRDPKWLTQRMNISEKLLFHFIHALHLAGRCTECGECERVCPMEIPVTLMKEKLGQITRDLLRYEAGLDPEAVPPLLTFDPSETGI